MGSMTIISALIVLGVLLLVASGRITVAVENQSADNKTVKANQGIYTMGIIFLITGVSLGACEYKCTSCDLGMDSTTYLVFLILLGIALVSLGGVIVNDGIEGAKSWGTLVLVLGLLFIVICSTVFYLQNKDKFSHRFASY